MEGADICLGLPLFLGCPKILSSHKDLSTCRTLRVPDQRHGWQGHSWRHEWCSFTLRNIPWKFRVDISMGSVSGRRGQEGGYLEDVDGSWLETWMTGSFLTSSMMFFYPKEGTLKISCWYLNGKCVRKGGSRRGVLGGRWGFLTGDMDDRVIPDVMNDDLLPQGRYSENFVLIS